MFSPYGRIGSVRVPRDRRGRIRGVAYVELDEEAAATAVQALRGTQLLGRTMDLIIENAQGRGGQGGFRRRR